MRLETREQKRKRIRNKKIKALTAFLITFGVIAVLAVMVFVGKIRLDKKNEGYRQEISVVKEEIEKEKKRTDDLNAKKEYTGTKEYIEKIAKNKLGLIYPDEIIFRAED